MMGLILFINFFEGVLLAPSSFGKIGFLNSVMIFVIQCKMTEGKPIVQRFFKDSIWCVKTSDLPEIKKSNCSRVGSAS